MFSNRPADWPDDADRFCTALAVHGVAMGWTSQEIGRMGVLANVLRFFCLLAADAHDFSKAATTARDTMALGPAGAVVSLPTMPARTPPETIPPAGILAEFRAGAQRVKAHPLYTDQIGMQFGIIAAHAEATEQPPHGKLKALPGGVVQVTCPHGDWDGVLIEFQRGSDTGWTSLGVHVFSPWAHELPLLVAGQPEVRRYRLRYTEREDPVGPYSDIMQVTVTP